MTLRERIARALYERERARAENATEVVSGAVGRPVSGLLMEPWAECREMYLADADAVLEAMREPTEEMLRIAVTQTELSPALMDKAAAVLEGMPPLSPARQQQGLIAVADMYRDWQAMIDCARSEG